MKTIGIKLADGTFYPILEEGSPKKRMLDLTTAKDNQTKVQIDLYRSETGSMEDAEYVDTLEVTKLKPHPNGEPELHLSVGLDEENKLTAEVVDPETGKKSETEVNLVSRTLAERASPADFAVADTGDIGSGVSDAFIDHSENVDMAEVTFSPDELPEIKSDALEDMPFSFDHSDGIAASAATTPSTIDDISDFSGVSENADDLPIEDSTLESIDFSRATIDGDDDIFAEDTADVSGDDFAAESVPDETDELIEKAFEDPFASDNTFASSDGFVSDDTDVSDGTFVPDSVSDEIDGIKEESFSLPDFDDSLDSFGETDTAVDGTDIGSASATGLNFDDLDFDASEFETPDFDSSEFETPDFDMPSSEGITDADIDAAFADIDATSTSDTFASSGSAMDFSDLYDKETIAGEHASIYDEDEEVKKTRVPVIICIICAIICVLATVLILFIVPSKYNLIKSRNTRNVSDEKLVKTETVQEIPAPAEEKPIVVEVVPPQPEPAPVAVEDKIVVAEKPAAVVPAPAPKPEKKPDVKYHIRWGDTLWDLSESYYKTPWKYKKIASYNKIKDPDKIISGTDILIPAE